MRLSSESEGSRQIPEGIKEGSSGGVFPLAVPFLFYTLGEKNLVLTSFSLFLRFAALPPIRAAAFTLISPLHGLAGEDICEYIEETPIRTV